MRPEPIIEIVANDMSEPTDSVISLPLIEGDPELVAYCPSCTAPIYDFGVVRPSYVCDCRLDGTAVRGILTAILALAHDARFQVIAALIAEPYR